MANGSMSTQTDSESEIRKALIEADLVEHGRVARPVVFHHANPRLPLVSRPRQKEPKTPRSAWASEEIKKISDTYHVWRGKHWSQLFQRKFVEEMEK
jgi:hypothetical protein